MGFEIWKRTLAKTINIRFYHMFSALFHYVHITMTSKMFFLCLIASSVLTIKHNLQPTVCNSIQLQPRRTTPWRDRTSRRDGCTVAGRKLPPIILNLMNLTAGRTNDESLQQDMKQYICYEWDQSYFRFLLPTVKPKRSVGVNCESDKVGWKPMSWMTPRIIPQTTNLWTRYALK